MNPVQRKIHMRSTSIFGLSFIKLIFEDGVKDPQARQQVMNLLGNAVLPPNVQPSVQPPTGPTGELFRYTLRSSFRDVRELKTMQDWVIDRRLRSISGVADVAAFGGKTKTYEIQVDPGKLANLGLTPLDVFTAVQNTNINVGRYDLPEQPGVRSKRYRFVERYRRDQEYHCTEQQWCAPAGKRRCYSGNIQCAAA